MAPPGHPSSHSPSRRKRKSSTSSESDSDTHNKDRKKKDFVVNRKTNNNRADSKRSESVPIKPEGRWKHDKWKANDDDNFVRPYDRSTTSRRDEIRRDRRSQSRHRDRHVNSAVDDFMDHRRLERERITLIGVEQVWGKSPTHAEE